MYGIAIVTRQEWLFWRNCGDIISIWIIRLWVNVWALVQIVVGYRSFIHWKKNQFDEIFAIFMPKLIFSILPCMNDKHIAEIQNFCIVFFLSRGKYLVYTKYWSFWEHYIKATMCPELSSIRKSLDAKQPLIQRSGGWESSKSL